MPFLASLSRVLKRFLDHMVDSPCTGLCKLDRDRGLCSGCFRITEEIAGWPYMNREQKLQVHADAALRKQASAESDRKAQANISTDEIEETR